MFGFNLKVMQKISEKYLSNLNLIFYVLMHVKKNATTFTYTLNKKKKNLIQSA